MQFTKIKLKDNDTLIAEFQYTSTHDQSHGAHALLIPTNKDEQAGKHYYGRLDSRGHCQFKFSISKTFIKPVKFFYLRIIIYAPDFTNANIVGGVQMLSTRFDMPKKGTQKC